MSTHLLLFKLFWVGLFTITALCITAKASAAKASLADFADTVTLNKMRAAVLCADTPKPITPAMITLTGIIYGRRTFYWSRHSLHVIKQRPLADAPIGTRVGDYTTKSDRNGRFTLSVPATTTQIEAGHLGYGFGGYLSRSVKLTSATRKKPIKLKLIYAYHPFVTICPCF